MTPFVIRKTNYKYQLNTCVLYLETQNTFHHAKANFIYVKQMLSVTSPVHWKKNFFYHFTVWSNLPPHGPLLFRVLKNRCFSNVNTLRPRQNGHHFADNIYRCIFLNENVWIPIKISLEFVPKGPINNIPILVWIMAWRLDGAKPLSKPILVYILSEPMMICLTTHIFVTRPQWVKKGVHLTPAFRIYSQLTPWAEFWQNMYSKYALILDGVICYGKSYVKRLRSLN